MSNDPTLNLPPVAQDILRVLTQFGEMTNEDVKKKADCCNAAFYNNKNILAKAGLVESRRDGRRSLLALSNGAATVRAKIAPPAPAKEKAPAKAVKPKAAAKAAKPSAPAKPPVKTPAKEAAKPAAKEATPVAGGKRARVTTQVNEDPCRAESSHAAPGRECSTDRKRRGQDAGPHPGERPSSAEMESVMREIAKDIEARS